MFALRYRLQLWLGFVVALLLLVGPVSPSRAGTPSYLTEAIEAYRSLLAEAPRNVTLLNDLANLLALAGEMEEAEEAYREALELDPERVSTRYNLALLYQHLGRKRLANREFEAVLKLRPDHAWAH